MINVSRAWIKLSGVRVQKTNVAYMSVYAEPLALTEGNAGSDIHRWFEWNRIQELSNPRLEKIKADSQANGNS